MSRIASAAERQTYEEIYEGGKFDSPVKMKLEDSSVLPASVYLVMKNNYTLHSVTRHYSIEQVDSMITALTYFRDRAIERRNDETETE